MNVGNMGSAKRLAWTVMGDNVNLASRLEGMTKQYRSRIVISEGTYSQVADHFVCRELDRIRVKGKHQPVRSLRIDGCRSGQTEIRGADHALRKRHEGVSRAELARSCRHASGNCSHRFRKMAPRRSSCSAPWNSWRTAPEPDWDGVYEMKSK